MRSFVILSALLLITTPAFAQGSDDTSARALADYASELLEAADCPAPPCALPPTHEKAETTPAAERAPVDIAPDTSTLDIKTYETPQVAHEPAIITLEGDQ